MANEAGNKINKEIDEKLKKIMEQRNIHNEVVVNADADTLDNHSISGEKMEDEIFIERRPRDQKLYPPKPDYLWGAGNRENIFNHRVCDCNH